MGMLAGENCNGMAAYQKVLTGEAKKRYDENWDRIFGKKKNEDDNETD